jgi:Na+-driven multidrug efflux pump
MTWLKGVLAKVYGDYGLVGAVVVVLVAGVLVYVFGEDVLKLLGG